jgi:polygalacturonase
MRTGRREFLTAAGAGALGLAAWPSDLAAFWQAGDPWAAVPSILARIRPPVFPARDFDITKFGAVAGGGTDSTKAIAAAIAACRKAGGGRVVVPAGRFLTGAIRLESGVNLHVTDGATLAFSQDPRAYLPAVFTRWEGVELMNYSALIYAFEAENIAVTGGGTLDGQADDTHWWPWKGNGRPTTAPDTQHAARARLIDMAARGVPVASRTFGAGDFLRPNFIQPYRSRNVLVEGIRITNSPMWEIHPVLCQNVTVRGVTVVTHGPNNDGCNPESCGDVLIEGCTFDTGDDCIAIKSGRNDDGRRLNVPSENIVIRDCVMKDGHGGVVIGSEISGSARNIFAERCRMDSPQLDRALRLKTNAVRGGVIENIFMRDVTIGQVAEAVVTIDFYYEEGAAGSFLPTARNIELRNVTSRKSLHALRLRGFEKSPIQQVRIRDCRFDGVGKPDILEHVQGLTWENTRVNGELRR